MKLRQLSESNKYVIGSGSHLSRGSTCCHYLNIFTNVGTYYIPTFRFGLDALIYDKSGLEMA